MQMINSALSGLHAASAALHNSANNVANIHSVSKVAGSNTSKQPYQPTDITQSSVEPQGGVQVSQRKHIPSEQRNTNYALANEMPTTTNVSLEREAANQIIASNAYKSNLKSLEAYMDMTDNMLDITS